MKIINVLITILALTFAVGCSREQQDTAPPNKDAISVVGAWAGQDSPEEERLIFHKDGTVHRADQRDGVWAQDGFTVRVKLATIGAPAWYILKLNPKGDVMEGPFLYCGCPGFGPEDDSTGTFMTFVRKGGR